jgi:hypothetical protein
MQYENKDIIIIKTKPSKRVLKFSFLKSDNMNLLFIKNNQNFFPSDHKISDKLFLSLPSMIFCSKKKYELRGPSLVTSLYNPHVFFHCETNELSKNESKNAELLYRSSIVEEHLSESIKRFMPNDVVLEFFEKNKILLPALLTNVNWKGVTCFGRPINSHEFVNEFYFSEFTTSLVESFAYFDNTKEYCIDTVRLFLLNWHYKSMKNKQVNLNDLIESWNFACEIAENIPRFRRIILSSGENLDCFGPLQRS